MLRLEQRFSINLSQHACSVRPISVRLNLTSPPPRIVCELEVSFGHGILVNVHIEFGVSRGLAQVPFRWVDVGSNLQLRAGEVLELRRLLEKDRRVARESAMHLPRKKRIACLHAARIWALAASLRLCSVKFCRVEHM